MTSSNSAVGVASHHRISLIPILLLGSILFLACQSDSDRIATFLERGEAYVEKGEDAEAIIEFKNVLQRDPENPAAHEALSLAYLRVSKPREAYWELSETVRVDPENSEARLRYGTISAAIGDYDVSFEQAEAILRTDSNDARALTLRAQALENREDYEGAEADFREAVKVDPSAAAFHYLLGGFYERRGRYEEAEATFERLLATEESYVAALALGRTILRDQSREEEADRVIERVIELAQEAPIENLEKPRGAEDHGTTSLLYNVLRQQAMDAAYTLKAVIQYQRGGLDEALATLEEGVAKSEDKVPLIYQLADLYRREGRFDDEHAMIVRATEVAPDNAETQVVLSAHLGQRGDAEGALAAARAAVKAEPENRTAQLREAELLVDIGFRDGDPESTQAGRSILDSILESEPGSPEAHFIQAKIELAEDDLDAAKISLEVALQARPNWGQARYVLGSTLVATGELTRARVELESAVEAEPQLVDGRKLLTQVYAQLGEYEFAIEEGRTYLQSRPGDREVRIIVGQSLIRVGRAEEAYEEIAAIPDEDRDAASLFALARIDLGFGRVEEGASKLIRAEEMTPGNPQILRSLLVIDRNNNDLDASAARVARALEAKPDDSEIVELDAEMKLLSGDFESAKASLAKAVELEPRNTSAQLALADFEIRAGNPAGTVAIIERAAAAVPESSDLQYRLAQVYEQNGRRPDAIDAYEKAISLNAGLAMAKNNLAYLLADSGGDLDRALELAQQAKEQLPDDGNVADTLGWVLLQRGLFSAAIGYLQEAAERLPENAFEIQGVVHNHLAEAYERNRETQKALEESRATLSFFQRLTEIAEERGFEPSEPDWSTESRSRIERLEATS